MRRCNHCNGQLGLIVHRKWMLRFCSKSCKKAYEHKLEEERLAKFRHLAFLAPGTQTNWRSCGGFDGSGFRRGLRAHRDSNRQYDPEQRIPICVPLVRTQCRRFLPATSIPWLGACSDRSACRSGCSNPCPSTVMPARPRATEHDPVCHLPAQFGIEHEGGARQAGGITLLACDRRRLWPARQRRPS
jgi:hypothetical protein